MLSADEFKRQADESKVVQEIFKEIHGWIPQVQTMLEDPDNAFSEKDYEQFRGSLKAIRNVLNAPTVMYERKLAEENGEMKEANDDSE